MTFKEVLAQVIDWLQQEQRISYRALKRQFDLDDDYLEDLKVEIIEVKQLAIDHEGKMLVWTGKVDASSEPSPSSSQPVQQASPQEAPSTHVESPPSPSRIPDAERRQLTVLFCDLVDSTKLASQLDPEDLREVIRAYQTTCAAVIQRFDGHIAQYLGDGLLVYFSYPQAHEDDAQRAVRTGLGMIEAIRELPTRLKQENNIQLAVRVGIHTGLVVVGEMGGGGRQEQLALGETPNIAARIQGLAHPNTVVISNATYRLVQGYFLTEDRGSHTLKGITAPQHVYRVVEESDIQSRLEIASPRGLTPLIGREMELALLVDRWEQVKKGRGQVVLLSGEAGIGKSRLVKALKDHLAEETHSQSEVRCSPYHQHSALYPIIDLLQRALQFQREDTPAEKLRRLEELLGQYGLALPEMVPLFAVLLSLPLPDHYPSLTLSPQRQRQKTLEALLALRLAIATLQPVLHIVEDLHWADPSTLEWLGLLLEQVPTSRILVLLTCRPEFHPPWSLHLTQLTLSRFDQDQIEVMINRITGGKSLPAEIHQQLLAKTDGVPLFVEELTKMVLESGLLRESDGRYELTDSLPALAIPTTLQDSLMARLDRLATAKGIAQLGATIGRQFSYELIQALSPVDEPTLQQELGRLVEAELLYQRGVPPQVTYLFKHALIQEAAYQSLLKSTRQQYHQQIAQVLEQQFPDMIETQPEVLAHHYTEAGSKAQAVGYWHKAGQRAIERSAYVEAIAQLTKGLELLRTLPDTPARIRQELDLQIALGRGLMVTKGYAAPEVEQAYARARELCQQVSEPTQLFPVLWGLWQFYLIHGELQTARALGEQLLSLAQHVRDPALLVVAHRVLGVTLFYLGELVSAQAHLQQGLSSYDASQHRALAFLYGQDPGVVCHSYTALILWQLGYSDQALEQSQEALALARELSHPFTLGYALCFAAILHQLRREGRVVQERVETAIIFSTEQGFSQWVAWGNILRGWALAEQRQGEKGVAQMHQGLVAWQTSRAKLVCPYFLALLAEVYGKLGQAEEGLSILAEALTLVDYSGERFYEAELHRLKGDLLRQKAKDKEPKAIMEAEAEACFHHALTIARRQQAKSLELRAAMSLSRLWQQQGKQEEARHLLAEIYDWFTEGFDTADLQEVRALLEELAG